MSQHSDDSELLKSYFLGTASAAERAAVEDRYMGDAAGVEELLLAEDELIDDYVRRALARGERELFEKNFLCTAERRGRLEFIRDLAESLTLVGAGETPAAPRRTGAPPGGAPVREADFSKWRRTPDRAQALDNLLEWLDPVRESAAEKYVAIHNRLSKIFALRGCVNAEELADETLRRASLKAPSLAGTSNPAMYVYALATLVLREQQESGRHKAVPYPPPAQHAEESQTSELTHACLERCLRMLSDSERELIVQYYSLESGSRRPARKELAQRLGVSTAGLRMRAHHIRSQVGNCVRYCLEQSGERP